MTFFSIESTPIDNCRLITCDKCGKTTWMGCGQHVEQVMKDVKDEDKCTCKENENGAGGQKCRIL